MVERDGKLISFDQFVREAQEHFDKVHGAKPSDIDPDMREFFKWESKPI